MEVLPVPVMMQKVRGGCCLPGCGGQGVHQAVLLSCGVTRRMLVVLHRHIMSQLGHGSGCQKPECTMQQAQLVSDSDGLGSSDPVPACLLPGLLFSPCCTRTPEHYPQVEDPGIIPWKSMENCWLLTVGNRGFCFGCPQSFLPQLNHTSLPSCGVHI